MTENSFGIANKWSIFAAFSLLISLNHCCHTIIHAKCSQWTKILFWRKNKKVNFIWLIKIASNTLKMPRACEEGVLDNFLIIYSLLGYDLSLEKPTKRAIFLKSKVKPASPRVNKSLDTDVPELQIKSDSTKTFLILMKFSQFIHLYV